MAATAPKNQNSIVIPTLCVYCITVVVVWNIPVPFSSSYQPWSNSGQGNQWNNPSDKTDSISNRKWSEIEEIAMIVKRLSLGRKRASAAQLCAQSFPITYRSCDYKWDIWPRIARDVGGALECLARHPQAQLEEMRDLRHHARSGHPGWQRFDCAHRFGRHRRVPSWADGGGIRKDRELNK